jgi:hypothetical protein
MEEDLGTRADRAAQLVKPLSGGVSRLAQFVMRFFKTSLYIEFKSPKGLITWRVFSPGPKDKILLIK